MKKNFYNYIITDEGKIFNKKGIELAGEITKEGYKRHTLYLDGKRKRFLTHRLIATLFLENKNEVVNHKDGNKLNNSVENLEWISYKQNTAHALRTGLKIPKSTAGFGQGKSTTVLQVDLKTGEIIAEFKSMKQAAEEVEGSFQLISAVINGKRKSHKGFGWMKK